jgi:serine/threonine protein phosphatase 1
MHQKSYFNGNARKGEYNRIIGIGDLHGCFDLLKKLVEEVIRFNPDNDQLVFLGDFLDRNEKVKEVVVYLSELKHRYPKQIVLLMGNHEQLCYQILTDMHIPFDIAMWKEQGGQATLDSFGSYDSCKNILIPFIEQLKLHHETPTHIFVHAGIPYGKTLETATPHELLWDRNNSYRGDKTLIVGHCIHKAVTKYHNNIVAVDTGAFLRGKLSAYDILNDKIYQAVDPTNQYRRRKALHGHKQM